MVQSLMKINLFHQYYDDNIWHNLCVKPDLETLVFFKRYHLLLFTTPHGIELFYSGSQLLSRFLVALKDLLEGQYLRFYLHNSDPYYAHLCDFPLDWAGQLNYHSQSFSADRKTPEIKQLNTQLVPRTVIGGGIIGQILIAVEDIQLKPAPTFVIQITARQTVWRYYVVNRTDRAFQKLAIHDGHGFLFNDPEVVVLPTGETALRFDSGKRRIALRQRIRHAFNLVELFDGVGANSAVEGINSKILIEGLPIPQANKLQIERHHGKSHVYSPMYIYL